MVSGSTTSTLSTEPISGLRNEPFMVRWRSRLYFAASALNGSPSWNFTPGRSLMVTVLPSAEVSWLSASCGTMFELLVDVEQLVADRREDDAPDIGARQRRIEHVGILGEADAQVGLGERAACHRGGERERKESASLFMLPPSV